MAAARTGAGVTVTFKTVDTCAAEFEASTPYHYSTWEDESEVTESNRDKVIILGSGPNRIGQGIEFDYCCVHASFALRDAGYETIMVNCNPETVSTDYDTSDRLYFEPITYEDVMNIVEAEQATGELRGIIVSLGGQTPLKLADRLPDELVLGTRPSSIDAAEDRNQWAALCERLDIPQPPGGTAVTIEEALAVVEGITYPALVRPSYVLGGRAMELVYTDEDLVTAMKAMTESGTLGREGGLSAERPVLIDRFLEGAIEVDVDAVRDATGASIIGGVMEHVEEAGVHSGDSACVLPPPTLSAGTVATLEEYTTRLAEALDVQGLLNVQYAVKDGEVFVIEANPRASRTVPFVSKATGRPLAKVAARVQAGATLAELHTDGLLPVEPLANRWSVKEAVLPFNRFPETDSLLGPEMRSTGEVMGIDVTPGLAFVKSQLGAGATFPGPDGPAVFMSLADRDKDGGMEVAAMFRDLGYRLMATAGTAARLEQLGIEVSRVLDRLDHGGTNALDMIEAGEIGLVVNTPRGRGPRADGAYIRRAAGQHSIPIVTTVAAARATARGLRDLGRQEVKVRVPAVDPPGRGLGVRGRGAGSVDLTARVGSVTLPSPIMTRGRHRRARGRAGGLCRPLDPGGGGGQVAGPLPLRRQRPGPGPPDTVRHDQLRRSAGPRRRRLAGRRAAPAAAGPGPGGGVDLGAAPSATTGWRPRRWPVPRPTWWPSRSTSRARTPRPATRCSPTRPR